MRMQNIFSKRFAELLDEADRVDQTAFSNASITGPRHFVDNEAFTSWKLKVRNLLANSCGKTSEHYQYFVEKEQARAGETNSVIFKRLRGIFAAAKEDYEGGYIVSARQLMQAEVFSSELDQATELLTKGYYAAAAVIAGVVLET